MESKKQMYTDLVETTLKIQDRLPITITDGLLLTQVEYKDTVFTLQYTIDEKEFPFENMIKAKQNRKQLLLTTISTSKGEERKSFEQCASHNVYVKYHFVGKRSFKEIIINVAPNEIIQALNNKSSAYDVLKMQIDGEKSTLPEIIGDGMVMTDIGLRDSMVYAIVKLDEENYQFSGIEDNIDEIKNDIRVSMLSDPTGIYFMKTIANAHFGLEYIYVGSISEKIYKVEFSPDEIMLDKTIYDANVKASSEIVECDE